MTTPWIPSHNDLLRRPEYATLASLLVQLDLAVVALTAAHPDLVIGAVDTLPVTDDHAEWLLLELIRHVRLLRRDATDSIRFLRAPPDQRPDDIPF